MTKTELKQLLSEVKTIALVGASLKPQRPSNEVMHFLQENGFKVYPVNPALSGQTILNERVYASLDELPQKVDMVDIFRNSEAAGEVCSEVLALDSETKPKIVWMQIGVINEPAAKQLRENNFIVVMNECPKQILSN
jgi:predicted CoA-binding protein